MLRYDNLMHHQRQIYDAVEQQALITGRDTQDVLLDYPSGDVGDKTRVAEVFGGPTAGDEFRAAYYDSVLERAAGDQPDRDPAIVRRFDDGRTAVVHATVDGRSLLEYADGSREVVNAGNTQQVGPDPDVMADAQASRERAAHARDMAQEFPDDPATAARSSALADQLEASADAKLGRSFDWMKGDMHADLAARASEQRAGDSDEF